MRRIPRPADAGRFFSQPAGASAGHARSLAGRLYAGHCDVPAALAAEAAALALRVPEAAGRVHAMGSFESEPAQRALRAALPHELVAALKPQLEWYACRGAGFHTDAHYDAVLFGAWCLAGPPREIAFARSGRHLPCESGDFVVFDPFEPHAVLEPGQPRYCRDSVLGAAPSVFLAFELDLQPAIRESFSVAAVRAADRAISSATPVNAETGAFD